ncbi:hypothetical protein CK203_062675 [Vitis vinifera]|uniref:Disease resistance protein n=1 Tax=Vitis vinifera TaxID=29760 RepID=A0A438FRU2_VITVI|nr:hypothetical protein CK203_062675 [Vitis vinifera]
MKVPPEVGELSNLEVLDFEGTEIISLPMDVGKLSKLTCLKLSFYGEDKDERKIIDHNNHSPKCNRKTSSVGGVSIDVNPDDERWNETVKNIIKEVCSLKGLKVLKLYLPEVVLLNEFKPNEISFHIPVEIKEVLQHATALFLDRHLTLTKLSEFGIENMKELEVCVLGECKEIQTLVDGAEINKQEDNAGDVNEETPKVVGIAYMSPIDNHFHLDLLENLNILEELVIENCPKIISLVTHELPAEEIQLCSIEHLPKLKKISLHYMHD